MYFNGISIWLAASVAAAMIISLAALHFLHRRYVRLQVPTLLFWQTVSEIQRRNRLGGRFNRLLTFLLLAIIALLLSLATVRPSVVFGGGARMRYVLVIDCRASMGIIEPGQADSRFDQARQMCKKQIASFAESDEIILIAVADDARTVCNLTDSRTTCLHSLADLRLTKSRSWQAMAQAIHLSEALMDENPNSGILLFTDHLYGMDELSRRVKQKLNVYSYARPVNNAALLGAGIVYADKNLIHLDVAAGYWGENSIEGSIELYKGEAVLQKKTVSMAPHTVSHFIFDISDGNLQQLSVRIACNDGFQEDNQLSVTPDADYRLFIADDIPVPIQACVSANPIIQRKDRPENADLSVTWVDSISKAGRTGIYVVRSRTPVNAVEKIIPTKYLYWNDMKRISVGYDLSAAFGSGLLDLSEQAIPLLMTSEGKIAAAMEQNGKRTCVFLDECLFGDQSTVWKQSQFPEMFQRWIALTYEYNGMRQKTSSVEKEALYANLWSMDNRIVNTGSALESPGHAVSLYPWVLVMALLLLGLETIAYYRGVVV